MKNISQRIKLIADNEGVKVTQLEAKIGASKGVLSRSIAKNTDIQSKWVTLIVENYPLYNSDWLLTGKGQMLKGHKDTASDIVREPEVKCGLCLQCEAKNLLIKEKDERIAELKDMIAVLKSKSDCETKRRSA